MNDRKPWENDFIFTADGVDKDALALRLNKLVAEVDAHMGSSLNSIPPRWCRYWSEAAANLAAAAMSYEQLCAGVSNALANAFKDETE